MKNGGLNTTQQYSTKQQIQVFEYIKINFQSFFCMFGLPNKIVGLKKKKQCCHPAHASIIIYYAEIIVNQTQ